MGKQVSVVNLDKGSRGSGSLSAPRWAVMFLGAHHVHCKQWLSDFEDLLRVMLLVTSSH